MTHEVPIFGKNTFDLQKCRKSAVGMGADKQK